MKKQLQFIFLFVSLMVFLFPKTSYSQLVEGLQGNGSRSNPVLIQSATDLKLVSDHVNSGKGHTNSHFRVVNDIDFSNEALAYDLDGDGVNESNFRPIGDDLSGSFFGGFFNGNNHTISGLKIKSAGVVVGLFGAAVGTSQKTYIRNVRITESSFENLLAGGTIVGGVVGYAQSCDLTDCSVSAEIVSNVNGTIAGGIIGFSVQSVIENCFFKGSITSSGAGSTFGGIVAAGGQSGAFHKCSANVTISSTGDDCYIGGFAGSTHSPIFNSYSTGTITVSGERCVVGGFIGLIVENGKIYNSYSVCNVTTASTYPLGGFVGALEEGKVSENDIINSYFINSWSSQSHPHNGLGIAKSASEMKSRDFVSLLNDNQSSVVWGEDTDNKNNGFPMLEVQKLLGTAKIVKNDNNTAVTFDGGNIKVTGKQLKFVQVTDVQGRIIKRENISGDYYQTELRQPMGIYIVTVGSASGIQSVKLPVVR